MSFLYLLLLMKFFSPAVKNQNLLWSFILSHIYFLSIPTILLKGQVESCAYVGRNRFPLLCANISSVLITEACQSNLFIEVVSFNIPTSIKGGELGVYKDSLHCSLCLQFSWPPVKGEDISVLRRSSLNQDLQRSLWLIVALSVQLTWQDEFWILINLCYCAEFVYKCLVILE